MATNLNFLYRVGHLKEFATPKVERWWVDALFLTLDRIIADRKLDHRPTPESRYGDFLEEYGFHELGGARNVEKRLAAGHLIRLYIELGGPERFSPEAVLNRERDRDNFSVRVVEDEEDQPSLAIHPTNLRISKSIPSMCVRLAICAGFEVVSAVQARDFNPERFILDRTRQALDRLEEQQVRPTMSIAELLKLTREE